MTAPPNPVSSVQRPQDDGTVWQDDPRVAQLNAFINYLAALEEPHAALLERYCTELCALGVPLSRVHVTVNALHPDYGSVGVNWHQGAAMEQEEYEHADEVPTNFIESPFYHLVESRQVFMRERLNTPGHVSRFPLLRTMAEEGASDYAAAAMAYGRLDESNPNAFMEHREGALMSWTTHAPDGFNDADLALIRATFPALGLAFRVTSNRQTAENLLGVYLGRDAGKRVLSGEIRRGSTRWINAVICYFDLEGFTNMSQQVAGEALIEMLNEYFGKVVSRIEENGGNVLKFMGDGLLAIFDKDTFSDAPDRALKAVRGIEDDITDLNTHRAAAGGRTFDYTIALHAGSVLYGNIGAPERLDFTVIGPEVNLAARIGGMHKSLGQRVILSEQVAKDAQPEGFELISLGRYMLRGVSTPRELFTVFDQGGGPDVA